MQIQYKDIKVQKNTSVKTFDFQGQKIEVLQYLPVSEKYDLLMITLQQAQTDGIFNDFKLNLYFELNLVYMYSNIEFSEEDRRNEFDIYDELKSNGFFESFFLAMNSDEYNDLLSQLTAIKDAKTAQSLTLVGVITQLLSDLPKNIDAANEILENFDPDKFQEVINFAKAANGGRDIKTNLPE